MFDIECKMLPPPLVELAVTFEPTYPYAEEEDKPQEFLNKRCPAWCDRILMTPAAMPLALRNASSYDLIGRQLCMGDHKVGRCRLQAERKGVTRQPFLLNPSSSFPYINNSP